MRNCDIKFVNKEITPFGGLSLFFKMLEKCHFEEHVMQSGVPLQGSNRGYKPIQLILGLFAGVWCGASCFGHLDVVRYDAALCDLLGWKRGADHRAYQRYLNKFSQAINQRVFGNLFGSHEKTCGLCVDFCQSEQEKLSIYDATQQSPELFHFCIKGFSRCICRPIDKVVKDFILSVIHSCRYIIEGFIPKFSYFAIP